MLVTGAGPIGQLAALLGAQRGLDVHVLDRVNDGPKPQPVTASGRPTTTTTSTRPSPTRSGPTSSSRRPASPAVIFGAMAGTAPYGIVVLTGVSSGGRELPVDAGALNREIVLENDAVPGRSTPTCGTTSRRRTRWRRPTWTGCTGW